MSATFDHYEIPAMDAARLAAFLQAVFGWRLHGSEATNDPSDSSTARYLRLAAGEEDLPGAPTRVGLAEGLPETLDRPMPVVRLTGETIEACLERVTEAGGRVRLAPRVVGDTGRFAHFEDPEGNAWGLWQPSPS